MKKAQLIEGEKVKARKKIAKEFARYLNSVIFAPRFEKEQSSLIQKVKARKKKVKEFARYLNSVIFAPRFEKSKSSLM